MTEISDKNVFAASDAVWMETIGSFIRHHRLQQNKTQGRLAKEAGIVRSTLSLFEKGQNTSLLVFVQLLRALKLLNMLQEFRVKQQISPLELARLEQKQRYRARRLGPGKDKPNTETSW
jgi:transcriptional regulator with XRE-family HTH domain